VARPLLQSPDRCYDFKIFPPKKNCEKLAFLTQNKAKLCKIFITLVFEKNTNFFTENWQKSQKSVIITSTPGLTDFSWCNIPKRGKNYPTTTKYTKWPRISYQMVVNYSKWPQNIPTLSFPRHSKVYPNRFFCIKIIPSGNPVLHPLPRV
jgi:hypothetical protein